MQDNMVQVTLRFGVIWVLFADLIPVYRRILEYSVAKHYMETRLPVFRDSVVLTVQTIWMCESILQRSSDDTAQDDRKGLKITSIECVS